MERDPCPYCGGQTYQETVHIDMGYYVPVEPEHCLDCFSHERDWRYLDEDRATGLEVWTGYKMGYWRGFLFRRRFWITALKFMLGLRYGYEFGKRKTTASL